jgi:ATP-binding cassette subfamily B multidrug efflux pump
VKSLRRLAQFIKPYRWRAALALTLLLGMVAADMLIPRLTQSVVDDGIARGDLAAVLNTAEMMLAAAFLSALCAVGNTILSVRVGQGVGADLRSALVRKVQTFSFGNLDRLQTGELLVRATSDITQVQMIVMMSLRILTRAPLWMLFSIVMLILTSPRLALLMALLSPMALALVWFFAVKAQPMFRIVQEKLDRLNQVMQENLAGVRVVKAFVRAPYETARFDRTNVDLTERTTEVMRLLAGLFPTMTLIINLGFVGILWIGGNLVVGGQMTLGEIVASINYVTYSLFPVLMLGMMIGPLSAAEASAGRILEILDAEPDVQESPHTRQPPAAGGRLVFENVCFGYDGAESGGAVLREINLTAGAGEKIAVLGATGSGKSSLVHLIPRFYDVTGGRITLDGIDVRDIPLQTLRGRVGIAMQETVLFRGTLRDNIRYGRPDAAEEEVVAAAKAARAHDFIMSFPKGYDTAVGERGVTLSGGQKQRIAIARALLVRPSILILDDSTSAVDVETEAEIEGALDEWMKGRTRFIIAQRVSTVLNADKIVVLDQGRVAAAGPHNELIATSPIYREIYESQLGNGATADG